MEEESFLCCQSFFATKKVLRLNSGRECLFFLIVRLFFANYTSSLLAVNSTLLAYGVGIAAIVGAVILALYFLSSQQSGYSSYNNQYRGFRSEGGQ